MNVPCCLAFVGSLLAPLAGRGQTAPADTTQAPTAALWTFFGYVDAYYGYDFPDAAQPQRPAFLYSHNRQNEFTINHGLVGARYQEGAVRGALALHAGTYVEANYAAETPLMQHVYEAYAGFRPLRKTWLDLGIFTSHIGFESAISKDNWTLTRSIMAENSPYFEAGARFTYEATPKLTLTALLLNGWQTIRETNRAKAVGTQVQWKPTAKWLLNSSTFWGNEQPLGLPARARFFHNLFATYSATQQLSLAAVFDLGWQQAPGRPADNWYTGAAFARFAFTHQWAATARAEFYAADHGVVIRGITPEPGAPEFQVHGASLNMDYAPTSHLLVRLEGRVLRAPQPLVFAPAAGGARTYGNATASVALGF